MKKDVAGYLAIILSGIVLSLELYGLNIIKYLEMKGQGTCYTDAMRYAYEAPISIALLIPIFIIGLGVFLIVQDKIKYKK